MLCLAAISTLRSLPQELCFPVEARIACHERRFAQGLSSVFEQVPEAQAALTPNYLQAECRNAWAAPYVAEELAHLFSVEGTRFSELCHRPRRLATALWTMADALSQMDVLLHGDPNFDYLRSIWFRQRPARDILELRSEVLTRCPTRP